MRPRDYERFSGFEARIETVEPVSGHRKFRGRLLGLEADAVRIDAADGEVTLPLDLIKRAKLVLTDELTRAAQTTSGH